MPRSPKKESKKPAIEHSEYEFDVFISYSGKDKSWVRGELLKRIEKAGLKAFIDFRDFTPGAISIQEMERGVLKCRKTLLVLTPDYIKSEYCGLEGIMSQKLSPTNRDLHLIPILKKPCEKPLYVGALTHIDFTDGADHDLAWRQLLTALGKPPEQKPQKEPERGEWFLAHPYPMPPNFTGRVDERKMLSNWLNTDAMHPMLVLCALGGFGKSALAWHWLMNDVTPKTWLRVVWWSFYEGDASFDHFIADTLKYLGVNQTTRQSLSAHEQVECLLQVLHESGTLLVLDGFERALRAYGGLNAAYQGDEPAKSETNERDCISPFAELFLRGVATLPGIRAKILLTTRLLPRVLEAKGGGLLLGCCEEELKQMQPADAVEFFHAQGIRGTHTEIEAACTPYGFHPLSLRLLAGLIVGDFQQPGDITAAKRLDVSGDLVARQHHVLETAYNSLTPERQKLLGRIACFRSPVRYDALKALDKSDLPLPIGGEGRGEGGLDTDLRDLVVRGLLHHDTKEGRFDLHPIVRRYAYDRLTAPDRTTIHTRLRDYFAAVPNVEKVTRLEDLTPVIELYHHTVRAGQFDGAWALFCDRLRLITYYQLGAYQLIIDLLRALFLDDEYHLPWLKDVSDQAIILNDLANSYSLSGQPRRALPLFEASNNIDEKRGEKKGLAIGWGNVAYMAHICIGNLRTVETNLRRSIMLSQEIKNEFWEAVGHQELGRLLIYCGVYNKSEAELATALKMFEMLKSVQGQGICWAYRALGELLRPRSSLSSEFRVSHSALESARRALELADEDTRTSYPVERDYVRANWLLGVSDCIAGQHEESERHLNEALERCRRINAVDAEADILIDLARLRAETGSPEEARRLVEEALVITERSGYVLKGADAQLELAKLKLNFYSVGTRSNASLLKKLGDAVKQSTLVQRETALEHAKEARKLATCDGPPDYTYKAAYDEAGAFLSALGGGI